MLKRKEFLEGHVADIYDAIHGLLMISLLPLS